MDIVSHGLWAGALCKAANKKSKQGLRVWLAGFWGVFPDLFAFTIPFVWFFGNMAFGEVTFSDLPRPEEIEPASQNALPAFRLAPPLYNISHSAVVFLAVFSVVYLIVRWRTARAGKTQRVPWEMGGWLLHIIADIPTHSYQFYPTPFLWPISDWKFSGFSWGTPWFIIPNYIAILIVYALLRKK